MAASALVLLAILAIAWQARVARAQASEARAQRDRARTEAAKAERINKFLQDTLGSANPGWNSSNDQIERDPRISQVLDSAAARAEGELSDQPEVLAAVLRTIGQTYIQQGRLDQSEQLLRRALEIDCGLHGDEQQDVAQDSQLLGEVLSLKADFAGAETLLRQSVDTLRRLYERGEAKPVALAGATDDLALLKLSKGDAPASERLSREALAVAPQLAGGDRGAIAISLANLGRAREAQGDLEGAESFYRQSIDEYRRLPGRERMEQGSSLLFLGNVLRQKGDLARAEPLLEESRDVFTRQAGGKSPYLAVTLNSLSQLYYLKGDYAQAEQEISRALAIFRTIYREGDPNFAPLLTTEGLILTKTGRAAQAEAVLRDALRLRTKVLPKGNWQIAYTAGALGECLLSQRRHTEAEPLLVESYNDLKASQGEQNPKTREARRRLAALYLSWGKPDEAAHYNAQ